MNQYHQYMAGAYGLPPAAPIAAYGHPTPSWPSQGAPAIGGTPLLPFQAGHHSGLPPPLLHLQPPPAAAPLWPQWPPTATAATAASAHSPQQPLQLQAPPLPNSGLPSPAGLPIHQVRFPPSPSPLPAWAAGSSPSPVYTTAPEQPTPFPQFGGGIWFRRSLPGVLRPGATRLAAPHLRASSTRRSDPDTAAVRQDRLRHL